MAKRGVEVDHSTAPAGSSSSCDDSKKAFRQHKRPVGKSWRMDETYIKVSGQGKYLYRAVDKAGNPLGVMWGLCLRERLREQVGSLTRYGRL